MRRHRRGPVHVRRSFVAAATIAAALTAMTTVAACDGDDPGGEDATAQDVPLAGTVAVPEQRLSPFCQAMIDLGDQLLSDPPDDPDQLIIETYEGIEDEVPAEIAADFDAVLAGLRGEAPPISADAGTEQPSGTEPPATAPDGSLVDEFIVPASTPSERLNDYVEFACRSTLNNPGPPATSPAVDLTDEDEAEAEDAG